MIKKKASTLYALVRNHSHIRRDLRASFKKHMLSLKFINPGEAGNNLYVDSFDKEDEPIRYLVPSLEDEQRTKCGGVVGTPYLIIINIILINKTNRW